MDCNNPHTICVYLGIVFYPTLYPTPPPGNFTLRDAAIPKNLQFVVFVAWYSTSGLQDCQDWSYSISIFCISFRLIL